LGTNHSREQCYSKGSCRECGERHNTLLHKSLVYFTASTIIANDLKCDLPIITGETCGDKKNFLAKVLADTGANIALITEKLALQLAKKGHEIKKGSIETIFKGVNNTL
jgi:hypothetical protein